MILLIYQTIKAEFVDITYLQNIKYMYKRIFFYSAYCGGMWLAALRLTVEMANILEDSESQKKYSEILEKGKAAFEKKLWNGKFSYLLIWGWKILA